jgi:predicted anti-sigma-YlaC factor YlaD
MRCERSQRLIGLDLDRRLDERAAARLAAHLAGCEGCRAQRAKLARAWDRLGGLAAGPAPAEDWAIISARIAERTERRPWLRWPLPVRRAVGGLAVAGLASLGILAGDAIARAALVPDRSATSLEAVAIADGFGDLPFGGPTPALLLAAGPDGRSR